MTRTCEWCEEPFAVTSENRKYCCAAHRTVAMQPHMRVRYQRPVREPRTPRDPIRRPRPERCKICRCGTILTDPRRQACDECREESRYEKQRAKDRRRRSRSIYLVAERYTMAEIAARDAHTCGLCHKPVPMDTVVPHPTAPTIDHVVPLAHGGDDTRANVQLAHFICNSTKRDGGWQQLRLVG